MSDQPELHPQLTPLAVLLGTWEGDGSGDYPTIEAFSYREQVTFGHVGKPFLSYGQRTWHPAAGTPMHAEVGYLRLTAGADPVDDAPVDDAPADDAPVDDALVGGGASSDAEAPGGARGVELVLAHPTGIVEVEEGELRGGVLHLVTTTVGLTATAKPVRALRRELRLQGDELAYDVWMAHADTPMTHHLHAVLQRTS